jgi:hypothetical protein
MIANIDVRRISPRIFSVSSLLCAKGRHQNNILI